MVPLAEVGRIGGERNTENREMVQHGGQPSSREDVTACTEAVSEES